MLRHFGFSSIITLLALPAVLIWLGPGAALATLVLIAIEVVFSFDNAIINTKVLDRLSPLWQQLFLTVGMLVAILGMRLIFPILIVAISAHLPWSQVVNEALHHPAAYEQHLNQAHSAIAAFGGSFLLTLALYFLFDDERQELWLKRIERPLQRFGGKEWLPPLITAVLVVVISSFALKGTEVLRLGLIGTISYALLRLIINGLADLEPKNKMHYVGWAAVVALIYLEVLDASFSFDSVLGAFAITNKVILIAIGLGIGALWVRSLTVYMVRRGVLGSYKYLEHGAHYAILVLAAALLLSIFIDVPDFVTGVTGLGVIAASLYASEQLNKAEAKRAGKSV